MHIAMYFEKPHQHNRTTQVVAATYKLGIKRNFYDGKF